MLKGMIYITDNIDIIYNTPIAPLSKIVSLDEDGLLDHIEGIVGGTCLLPPIEAKIAEADGNEQLYDKSYMNHLLEPYQQQFIAALISFLYKGGNLLLFLPEIGYNNTMIKLVNNMFTLYGIHIGIIGAKDPNLANCFYDLKCVPIWLDLIYTAGVISAREFLIQYPLDATLISNEQVMSRLINELAPYGQTLNQKINEICNLHKRIHINPNIKQAISII